MKHSRYSFLFYLLLAFFVDSPLKSCIKEINTVQQVEDIFEHATPTDIFVFDVDDVILEPKDPDMQSRFHDNPEIKQIVYDFSECMFAYLGPQKYDDFIFTKLLNSEFQPVEQALIRNILDIQRKNIKVIALTNICTGKVHTVERLEEWRYKQILDIGLDFSSSFPGVEKIIFDELRASAYSAELIEIKKKHPCPALFYKGILCSAGFPKGAVLKAFLEKIDRPTGVKFFDDAPKNVESVAREMEAMGIPCQAFVYKAAMDTKTPTENPDIPTIRFQYDLMKHCECYVSYSAAKNAIEQLIQPAWVYLPL